jgi:hypothetical protein
MVDVALIAISLPPINEINYFTSLIERGHVIDQFREGDTITLKSLS